jgi:amino-acid N-acetyltransferase
MLIERATDQRGDITAILSAEKLPVDDLPETLDNFFVATEEGQLTGVAGIEIYGDYGLLRSLTVRPDYRRMGIAGKLIESIENLAALKGLKELYLLTETAPAYFAAKGFQKITRDKVPDEIKKSSEFSHVCPLSATVMKKSIS